jgi:hypothetical protein
MDLADERKAAVEAVFERGHIPIALERFSPANATDLEVIKKAMSDSQIYILILGHRYGDIIRGQGISFTEFEYNLAQEYKLHTLVFLMDMRIIEELRSKLQSGNTKENFELMNYGKLLEFHQKVRKHFLRIFKPGPEFKYIVQLALADNLSKCEIPGFIREPSDPAVLESAKNEFIGDLVSELTSFEKLYERTQKQAEKKRGVSQFFVEQYMGRLLSNKVSLFFESGSTIAFVAKEMLKSLHREVTITDTGAPSMQISTNNVLAYLLLWLRGRIPCTKFPWSPPVETTYGAAYGSIVDLIPRSPDYTLTRLDQHAWKEIRRLIETPFTLTAMRSPTLLMGAASGLQLSSNYNLTFVEPGLTDMRKQELQEQLSKCLGPHVGSYHNKVFKRFMYATKLPIVIFLTDDKIDCEIEVGKCHFILDNQFSWQEFSQHHPVAFCVGCTSSAKQPYANMFRALGFDVIEQNNASTISSFIARNFAFIQNFELALTAERLGNQQES